MPHGGRREGAGRPRGSRNVRHKVVIENPSTLMPVEWMLAVLRDPQTEPQRRDRMAEIAAPYCHPRLAVTSVTTNANGRDYNGGGDINIVQIFSVPHGGRIGDDGTITLDGEVSELKSVSPYEPTPALSDQREKLAPLEPPLPVVETEPAENVTRLDAFVRRRDDELA